MPVPERFGHGMGITLGVQVRAITGITDFSVDGVTIIASDIHPARNGRVLLTVDGDEFELDFSFEDETLEARDLVGHIKRRLNDRT